MREDGNNHGRRHRGDGGINPPTFQNLGVQSNGSAWICRRFLVVCPPHSQIRGAALGNNRNNVWGIASVIVASATT